MDNNVVLDDAFVAPHHARLTLGPAGRVQLQVLNTANGVRVDGRPHAAGATVDIKRVPETVPEDIAKGAHFKLEQAAPLGRLGHVDDVSAMILYLVSDESRFVTGCELPVDGGLTAR